MPVAEKDYDDRAGLRGYVQFKHTHTHTHTHSVPSVAFDQRFS